MDIVNPPFGAAQAAGTIISLAYLAICGAEDYRKRRISVWESAAAGALGLIWRIFSCTGSGRGDGVRTVLWGILPGILLVLLSFAAKGAAGTGDGICYLVLGILLDAEEVWLILVVSLFLLSVSGLALFAVRRVGRKTRMPFLTFSAAAWSGILAVRLMEALR